jgi:predicted Holliday junction resolvase-like endonuclease
MGGTAWDLEFLNGLSYVMGRLQGRVQERVRELRKRWKRMEITRDISRCLERERGRWGEENAEKGKSEPRSFESGTRQTL